MRYSNVLSSVFGFSGKGSLRLTVTAGSVLASARTYNLMVAGNPLNLLAGATSGQLVLSFLDTQAINAGEGAFSIQLTHTPNPFTNQKEGVPHEPGVCEHLRHSRQLHRGSLPRRRGAAGQVQRLPAGLRLQTSGQGV